MKVYSRACGAIGVVCLLGAISFVHHQVSAAAFRLANPGIKDASRMAAIADHSELAYCTPPFKLVLQRVLNACGLVGQEGRRGCQPTDVKTFASISDADFNALFNPLAQRGAIIMFDDNSDKLDETAKQIIQQKWDERHGARYFFIVARASRKGTIELNRALSHRRANSVLFDIQETIKEPGLDKQIGLLWLGSEYAQLNVDYCGTWQTSRPGKLCDTEAINRSAFISWVDCRL